VAAQVQVRQNTSDSEAMISSTALCAKAADWDADDSDSKCSEKGKERSLSASMNTDEAAEQSDSWSDTDSETCKPLLYKGEEYLWQAITHDAEGAYEEFKAYYNKQYESPEVSLYCCIDLFSL